MLRSVFDPLRQNECQELLDGLQERLLIVEDLHHRFIQYQTSFKKLLVEIGRRRQYKEAVEKFIEGIVLELRAMTEGQLYSSLSSRLLG